MYTVAIGGELAQLLKLTLGRWIRTRREIAQKAQHLAGVRGHLGDQRQLSIVGVSQQARLGVPQAQHAFDNGGVVPGAGVGSLIAGARDIGLVHAQAQAAVIGIG